jgi:protein SCO1/2
MMLLGSFSMIVAFAVSGVVDLKRKNEDKKKQMETQPSKSNTRYTGQADIGGNWLLYDTKGEPVTHKDFEGKYYLIYFGFTFCPDVCPVSLMKMSSALNKVKASKES